MENNRRAFFKGLAAFVSGVAAAKASTYIPKKNEPKEELMVSSAITLKHENGEEYHPLVVKKTNLDGVELTNEKYFDPYTLRVKNTLPKIRKANV